jgi:hypothetical protein
MRGKGKRGRYFALCVGKDSEGCHDVIHRLFFTNTKEGVKMMLLEETLPPPRTVTVSPTGKS